MIKKFLEYVSSFESNFQERIHGASLEEITRLEHLVGFPLPETYKDFLLYMGHDDGGLKIMHNGTTDISKIIHYYETLVIPGHENLPENSLMFGHGSYPEYDLALQCTSSAADPQVLFIEDGELVSLCADSLKKFLFRIAFLRYCKQRFPYFRGYSDGNYERRLTLVETLAKELGLQEKWFSDSIEICAETNDAALLSTQYSHGIAIRILASSEEKIEKISSTFTEKMGVSRQI